MKRSYLLIAIALIAVGILCDWRLSHAVDTERPASAVEAIERADIPQLLARIESLEKRVARLERTESPVRQADSRASEFDVQPVPVPLKTLPRDDQQRNKDDAPSQQINGQTWRFRLLGDTQPSPRNAR